MQGYLMLHSRLATSKNSRPRATHLSVPNPGAGRGQNSLALSGAKRQHVRGFAKLEYRGEQGSFNPGCASFLISAKLAANPKKGS